jgi:hypothetical protein
MRIGASTLPIAASESKRSLESHTVIGPIGPAALPARSTRLLKVDSTASPA